MTQINVLILCSNNKNILNYKSLQILKQICEKTVAIKECKDWTNISFYYSGKKENISPRLRITKYNFFINKKKIEIEHLILPSNDVNQIVSYDIKFDIIINENCNSQMRLDPSYLEKVIFSTLKNDGYYIDRYLAVSLEMFKQRHGEDPWLRTMYNEFEKIYTKRLFMTDHGQLNFVNENVKVQDWAILKLSEDEKRKRQENDKNLALELQKENNNNLALRLQQEENDKNLALRLQQEEKDHQLALRLQQEEKDHQLALRLQEEEGRGISMRKKSKKKKTKNIKNKREKTKKRKIKNRKKLKKTKK